MNTHNPDSHAAPPVAVMFKVLGSEVSSGGVFNGSDPSAVTHSESGSRISVARCRLDSHMTDWHMTDWLRLQNRAFDRRSRREWRETDFRRELESRPWYPDSVSFLANDGPRLVGALTLESGTLESGTLESGTKQPRVGRIHWLAVDPDYHRRGIGRLLVAACEQECGVRGLERIEIETLRAWQSAMSFYFSLGFRPIA